MSKTEAEKACGQENSRNHEHHDEHDHKNSHDHKHDCGHSHGHGHSHDQACGHDHSHDHDCGHDHNHNRDCSHDHGHDHDCGHHHDHECNHHHHEHEHHHTEEIPSVSVYTHDMAVVGSVRCRISGTYEAALDRLQSCMAQAAGAVESAGGLIGHVKAYAKEEARSCMLSITEGEDIQKKDVCGNGIYAESASIVFGVTTEVLENILREAFAEYLV